MAPLPVIADTFRVTLNWYLSNNVGAKAANVLHFRDTTSTQDKDDLAADLNDNVNNNMFAMLDPQANIFSYEIIPLDGSTPTGEYNFSTARGGSGTGEGIAQAAVMVKLQTEQRGPKGRGRIFLPFLEEGAQVDGALDPTKRSTAITNWIAFRTAMTTDGWQMVVASYAHQAAYEVTGISVRTVSGTIRRRVNRLAS